MAGEPALGEEGLAEAPQGRWERTGRRGLSRALVLSASSADGAGTYRSK